MIKCFTQMIKYWHHIRAEVDHDALIYKTLSLLQEGEAKGQHNCLLLVTFILIFLIPRGVKSNLAPEKEE